MRISVIGHGSVGSALIRQWAACGHEVIIGARNPADEKLAKLLAIDQVTAAAIPDSIADTDAIVIAVPAQVTAELAKGLGDLSGRVVIDATNSVFQKPDPYENAFSAFKALTNAKVAKCFNTTGAENMENPYYPVADDLDRKVAIDMFVAGSDREAKDITIKLSEDIGFITHDFGGDDKVPLMEEFCKVWINLAMSGMGRNFAFKILER
mgnify:CR=1 FL=1